ncbi:MAG: NERD domain-containing protein/DEAD/DEAH box helicase [Bacteroidetes bacterium]|nr:NERD domain-containing protein/DEAD/DEAH box helicase [Bacteroidota bacterium]MBU1371378.1 NERD domain-containing protein/DEAD/DEAH box helicase [Bacteroidota bacterium]MBU1485866.1 NERD domain-containing protein/DEAD/DEAH box helicase [Bacteroidota bacterium]MBU1761878.1 NERD domain-containing protein/DEAD/DEAH box helicase [Bacteroidota bacterium]MBU2045733.1 NERD domain-containing protein/DEAD/DEAH box helicase [Bacteroidota bacterium]
MALLNPELEVIKRQKEQPTAGEWHLLHFLLNSLDDSYEIYFQPYLNGDKPDIILMRKGSGVLIIEVKDWRLEHYYCDTKTNWHLIKDGTQIKSPLKQVDAYKENLFNLHLEELYLKNIKNKNNWATVNCAIYFHNASEQQLTKFVLDEFNDDQYLGYRKFVSYFGLLGNDSLSEEKLNRLLTKFWLNKSSYYFNQILYDSFFRYLQAPLHQIEDGKKIIYSGVQKELIKSEIRPRRKIKGVAGSGKTLVLAKRAVNAHMRTGSRVLILTYNLSLKNYIHDRINDVREEFLWSYFYITNYHQFFKSQANNHNKEIHGLDAWHDVSFFDSVKNQITKFDAVFIDEIQDYRQEWLDVISSYFMDENSEWVVFGDEKQDIYQRHITVRNIPGAWNKSLDNSYRFTGAIANLAMKFQKHFFDKKYELDDINVMAQLDFEKRVIEHHYFSTYSAEILFEKIYKILELHKIHSSDCAVLCSKVELLRQIDFLIRTKKREDTTTTFELEEEYMEVRKKESESLKNAGFNDQEIANQLGKKMSNKFDTNRKIKKNHFWMKTGTVKLSTIHSFKGWEINTLFLIIENDNIESANPEVIYAGLTRAKSNLIIFNLNNLEYKAFFNKEIEVNFE